MLLSGLNRQHLAAVESKGIVIIANEDGQSLEPVAWIPVALLRQKEKIEAVLRFGDLQQLLLKGIPGHSPASLQHAFPM
jgi:hypothetical protein